MASTNRGKMKEHFEGIHRNLDWCIHHINECLVIVQDEKHPMYAAINALGEGIKTFDQMANDIYTHI